MSDLGLPESEAKRNGETYDHPLFAVIGGEAIPLEGHQNRGVMSVLIEMLGDAGVLIEGKPIRLVNDPMELIEQ